MTSTATLDSIKALYGAAGSGNVERLHSTIARVGVGFLDSPNPERGGQTAMHSAAENGHAHVIAALAGLGSRAIDAPSDFGCTPLKRAVSRGHVNAVEMLVQLGSRAIDTPDSENGWTPLMQAAWKGHANVIESLVRLGSKAIDTLDWSGRTALSIAAQHGQPHCIAVLKALGADPNATTFWLPAAVTARLLAAEDVEEVLAVRFRVYFAESLVHRLLFLRLQRFDDRR